MTQAPIIVAGLGGIGSAVLAAVIPTGACPPTVTKTDITYPHRIAPSTTTTYREYAPAVELSVNEAPADEPACTGEQAAGRQVGASQPPTHPW